MKIVENRKGKCSILLPDNPTMREKFAAEELTAYIHKISGAELSENFDTEYQIIIGGPERNKAAAQIISQTEFERLVSGPEGFLIKITEQELLIAGSSKNPGEQERGTLYGVYEFLERFLGCSLAAFSKTGLDAGEYVPNMSDIELAPAEYVKASSDVGYRTAIMQYGEWVGKPEHALNEAFFSWLAKNRYNRIMTWSGVYEGFKQNGMLKEAEKRGILFSVGHHEAITMLLPHQGNSYFSEHYAETHPEYYKLLEDGTRHAVKDGDYSGQLILCMRNEELIDQMAENIVTWSDANPQVDIISLWPYDGKHEQCFCEQCRKYSKNANYSYFVNKIVEKVNRVRPHIKIDRISYLDLTECDSEALSSSVVVTEATWHSTLRTIGKPDGSCFADSEFEQSILRWKKAGAQVVYYDYLMGTYAVAQKWLPGADEMQAVCKRFVEKDIYGLGTQIEVYNHWNNIFNFYTYGRTAYDTNLSMEDNLERFVKIFGAGASYVREVIRIGEKIADGQTTLRHISEYLMEHIDKSKIYRLYDEALIAAKEVRSRNNIRLMRMVFRYSDLRIKSTPSKDKPEEAIPATDAELSELWYMRENFDSFQSGKEGYGIAIPVEKQMKTAFTPDKWYLFE